jgi:hypothetical protein
MRTQIRWRRGLQPSHEEFNLQEGRASAKSETGGLQAFCLTPHCLIVEATVWMRLDVETWALSALVVLARATKAPTAALLHLEFATQVTPCSCCCRQMFASSVRE